MAINQDKVARFKAANAASPVVYGSALSDRGGCYYRLDDGSKFRLTRDECGAVGYPRWKLEEVQS